MYRPAGSTSTGQFDVDISPGSAGWGFCSLQVLTLPPGGTASLATGEQEMIVLPLTGAVQVEADGVVLSLSGRPDVFSSVTDFAYLPRDCDALLRSDGGGTFALPGARATRRLPVRYGPAAGVPVELRGAGNCSRQVNNFATPGSFETDKLIACEVLTPAGNWSSYPPHKHDQATETESELEEIYYYRFRPVRPAGFGEGSKGVGYQRVYGNPERPIQLIEEVGDGDVVLVPHGWHGPSIASPSHDMYYLNPMAGPAAERAWKISDDPDHGWIRDTWAEQDTDPRLPFSAAPGSRDPQQPSRPQPSQPQPSQPQPSQPQPSQPRPSQPRSNQARSSEPRPSQARPSTGGDTR